jgi:hypothetical protein
MDWVDGARLAGCDHASSSVQYSIGFKGIEENKKNKRKRQGI